jgi:glyoxylase-like metal-dependent hydrolase (beta-lactamase superfamily II)
VAARGARLARVDFPSYCGLLQHPQHGWMLYDTGYSEHFFTATERFPERLYRSMLPVQLPAGECLLAQLAARGLAADDIGHIIISHYHGDHVAGLRDFPRARYVALRADSDQLLGLRRKRWQATVHGQLPGLLPDDFLARLKHADDSPTRSLPAWMAPFDSGLDLFADGSLLGVPLPGHSQGQLGLYITDAEGRPVLLAADACYSLPACREDRMPPAPTLWFSSADARAYRSTFTALGALSRREPALAILPSHCSAAREAFDNGS